MRDSPLLERRPALLMEAKTHGVGSILLWTRALHLGVRQPHVGKGIPAQLFSPPPSPLHSCVTGLVDNDCLPSLVHIMVHAKVGSYPVQQHPMVRGHLRELLELIAEKRRESIRI